MKRILILLVLGLFISCKEQPKEEIEYTSYDDIIAEESSIDIDTFMVDSTTIKMETLLSNTENAHTKVKEIKKLKQENTNLKKELILIKEELKETKAIVKDTINDSKKKKSFIQKVISTIKKDTL